MEHIWISSCDGVKASGAATTSTVLPPASNATGACTRTYYTRQHLPRTSYTHTWPSTTRQHWSGRHKLGSLIDFGALTKAVHHFLRERRRAARVSRLWQCVWVRPSLPRQATPALQADCKQHTFHPTFAPHTFVTPWCWAFGTYLMVVLAWWFCRRNPMIAHSVGFPQNSSRSVYRPCFSRGVPSLSVLPPRHTTPHLPVVRILYTIP